MIADSDFADKIMKKYMRFGIREERSERLVFLLLHRERTNPVKKAESLPASSTYQLLLRFYMTWQNYVRSGQRFSISQNLIEQILKRNKNREYYFKNDEISRSYNQYAVFWNIASIFENRGRRPDLAKKAERELIRTLSTEFYTEMVLRRKHADIGKEYTDSGKEKQTAGERQAQIRRIQRYQEELGSTKRVVGMLEEQMKLQETILTELRQKIITTVPVPDTNVKKITGEVMKQMEREMHLERLRRGL